MHKNKNYDMVEQTFYESKPSGKVVVTWIFTKLLLYLLIYGFVFFITEKNGFGLFGNIGTIMLSIIGLILIILVYLIFLWKTYSYKVTDKGIYFKCGIIVRKQKFVPFFKITNVETTQNIIEQMLGINKLGFQTAGTGGRPIPEIVFEGLEDIEKPKQLVYQLIEKAKKSSKYDE